MDCMEYKEIIKYWSKVWKQSTDYADTLNWGYIGGGIFIALFAAFLYDSLASSQVSVKFLLVLIVFIMAVYYFGGIMFGGMAPSPQLK